MIGDPPKIAKSQEETLGIVKELVLKYPEMTWLTGKVDASPEVNSSNQVDVTVGKKVFPSLNNDELVEFNRTAIGILALHWVMDDDYESFTSCQNGSTKLSRESFEGIREYTKSILKNKDDFVAMETFMVINDLGKIRSVVKEIIQKTGITDVDHDKMLLIGLEQHPEISPSFQKLSEYHRILLLNGLKTQFNIGQFIQGECVAASLEGLKNIDGDTLKFYLLHAFYDIAGAAGQAIQNGSAVMNEATYKGFAKAIDSLEKLNVGKTVDEVYDLFLSQRATEFGLDVSNKQERAITRICCMLRLTERTKVQEVLQLFEKLPSGMQSTLVEELNINGTNDGFATLVYYAPALLTNLYKQGKLELGLGIFSKIFTEARTTNIDKNGNGIYTIMAANLAKMAGENPEKIAIENIKLKALGADAEVEITN